MVEQKKKNYTITTPMGIEVPVRRLSKKMWRISSQSWRRNTA